MDSYPSSPLSPLSSAPSGLLSRLPTPVPKSPAPHFTQGQSESAVNLVAPTQHDSRRDSKASSPAPDDQAIRQPPIFQESEKQALERDNPPINDGSSIERPDGGEEENPSEEVAPVEGQATIDRLPRAPRGQRDGTESPASKFPTPSESNARSAPPRKRKAPTKLEDEVPHVVKSAPATHKRKQPSRTNWSAEHLLSNPKSKLSTINLTELLSNDRAWRELSREEQVELLALLPGATMPDLDDQEPLPNIPRTFLKTNSSFQADVRLLQEDLAAGRYETTWLSDAQEASRKRARGDFDTWKEAHRESFWGQKQRSAWNALAGESSQHDLATLIHAGYFQVGDIWLLQRGHRPSNGQKGCFVEKEATISAVNDNRTLSFTFPPRQAKFSTPTAGADILLVNVDGPIALSNAILNEDGRIVGVRGANAWKEFRCIRKNQDMGSLWDVRELYHCRQC